MEQKEIKINCPKGFEIDEENSTFECIKFKPVKKEFPETWEEFCETHPRKESEGFVSTDSDCQVIGVTNDFTRNTIGDRNLLPSKELAEAMLALCQLIQLRDCYNNGWKPNWTNENECKYVICIYKGKILLSDCLSTNRILTFKIQRLRDQFLKNFKDLIEIAKPLL